jgi:pimeloyl-ACP methyl ester carboxylesterase
VTDVTFIKTNGIELEVFTAGSPTSDKLALCLHGFPEHAHSWRFQMPLLADLGYRVWAPNMRGYGNSTRPPRMRDYAMEELLADVAGLIDAAGAREVVLLAHDWGAVIAWYFAMRKIRPLTRLVIMNVPHPEPFARELRKRGKQLRSSWYVFFFQLPWLPEFAMGRMPLGEMFRRTTRHPENFTAEDLAIFSNNAATTAARRAMINYYRAMVRGGGGRRQRALGSPRIDVPTLMLWGEDDMALTKETTFGTEEHVSDLTIHYLPGISHWVQQDAPEKVNELLREWLMVPGTVALPG